MPADHVPADQHDASGSARLVRLAGLCADLAAAGQAPELGARLARGLQRLFGLQEVALSLPGADSMAGADGASDAHLQALRAALGDAQAPLPGTADGLHAWRLPFGSGTEAGTLLAVGRHSDFPDANERAVLDALLALAVATLRRLRQAADAGRFRRLVDSLPDAVVSCDAAGHVAHVNPPAARLAGINPATALGQPATRLLQTLDPETRQPLANALRQAMDEGRCVVPSRHALLRVDGIEQPVDQQACPIATDDGGTDGALLVLRDASDRLLAESLRDRLLREAEAQRERQAQAFHMAPSFMAVMRGPQHVFELANERYYQLVGHRRLIGLPVRDALPEVVDQGVIELLDRVYRSGEAFVADELPLRVQRDPQQPAELRWLEFVYQPLRGPDGTVARILVHGIDLTERKRAESAARERDQRLQLFLDNADDYGLIIADRERRVLEWLGGAEPITGWTADEAIGQPADLIFTDADRARGMPEREQAQAQREGRAEDRRWHRRKDGSLFYADGVMLALREPSGELRGFGKLFRDATARKRAEDELARVRAEAERRRRLFEAALANTPDLIYVLDLGHHFIYANEALLRIWGRRWDEAIGRTFAQLDYPADSVRQLDADADRVIRSGQPVRGEIAYDGTTGRRVYDYIFAPVIGADGEVEGVAGSTRDITERKRSEQRFAEVATASQQINSSLSVEHIARTTAAHARRIIGARLAAVAVLKDAVDEVVLRAEALESDDGALAECAARLSENGLQQLVCDHRAPLRLSTEALQQHAAWQATVHCVEGNAPRGWLAVPLIGHGDVCLGTIELADLREGSFSEQDEAVLLQLAAVAAIGLENARLYETLRAADRRKDEFLATLAHELRNPLAPMGYALELMRRSPAAGDREAAREMVARQLTQLVRLVDDLLDVARISVGKLQLRREPVALAQVVASAVETSRPAIDARQHRLTVRLPEEALVVDADPTRLAQVVMNLLNNAARYSEPGGRIELQAERVGDEVELRVRDTGIGIPTDMLAHIFEPFSQLDREGTRTQGGLGIGLTLVRRLVELHDGHIEARSAGPGHGSEFVVRLPLHQASAPARPADAAAAAAAPARRVLVVDDNEDAASSLAFLLAAHGHVAEAAFDGEQALAVAARLQPQVVVLDIGMPGMNGHQLARRLRQMPAMCDAVLIALTGWGQDADRRASRDAGIDYHLVKPADLGELQRLVATARH